MKKLLSAVLVLTMLLAMAVPALAAYTPKTSSPELVVTELNPNAANNLAQKWYDKFNGGTSVTTNADLYEFIEIANVSNKDVDLRNYAVAYHNYKGTYADTAMTFTNAFILKDWFASGDKTTFETANPAASTSYSYYNKHEAKLKEIANKIAAEKGYTVDQPYKVTMPTDSILKPGETAMIYIIQKQDAAYCQDPGDFKAHFGLDDDALVIGVNPDWNLSNNQIRRYAVVDMRDVANGDIKSIASDSAAVVSWAEVYTSNTVGDTGDGGYGAGKNGEHVEVLYGFSYASDPREGIPARNRAAASVGALTDLQKACFKVTASSTEAPALVISGLVANTYNSAARSTETFASPTVAGITVGAGANAFEAYEITNTSDKDINVYDYAIVRSGTLNNSSSSGVSFSKRMPMVAGNPVAKVDANTAYHDWMAANGNVNPATMTLAPGETALVWSYFTDAYIAGATLADFKAYYGLADDAKIVIIDTNADAAKGGNPDAPIGNIANTNTYVYGIMEQSVATAETYALDKVESYVVVNSTSLYLNIDKSSKTSTTQGFYVRDLRASFVYGMTNCADLRAGANVETLKLKTWKSEDTFVCTKEYGGLNLVNTTNNKLGVLSSLQTTGVKVLQGEDIPATGDATVSVILALVGVSAGVALTLKKRRNER